ncbi:MULTISPECIES: arylsulfatase [unclassified Lentimonas]|uniref:sulfatase family protein n=1 Tax=unclassified Lentimonas TaxID=2630993 RepID=UPI0013221CE4|nr:MULTISPECIES: arylsulfatase [unclassified Lentimonas]CAA6679902.1 Choline-sulfatase (EC [Lentimonas sp. CC4]CAA6683462.1 Choline-sulfatase (EC [Lentimonas sp. CC6]CAA7078061.1 Choline-sulfatase (EC [Lentimonas sp. CC4]CAA7171642.1 Choline-sulfatase (EC [Lentimonas sp. CC21]CAA7181428.1 Choline-sulfatase (EC [Lentimonas sp. CC8]
MKSSYLTFLSLCVASLLFGGDKPNIVFILADDMGYGDVQVLNPERCKIPTPNINALAKGGMIFTDAHTSSSVCTPARYGLMTGRYNWRSKMQRGVLNGYGKPLIPATRTTVASLLKAQGYNTTMIGKWHLGLNMPTIENKPLNQKGLTNIDWSGTIAEGPYNLGFDYYFGIAASLDMPPYIYIENDEFVGEATTLKAFKRKGAAQAGFEAVNVLDDLADKAVEFIHSQDAATPFFAYIALPSPHTPIVPTLKWQGKSELGAYGDFMMQTDAFVGAIMNAIEAAGLTENTILIVTSDNGCSKAARIERLQAKGHFPSAGFRGSKSDLWDGGHRVPFIVRWPASVEAGATSGELICLTDVLATFADLTVSEVPENAGEDSVSFLPALYGKEIQSTRKGIIHHSISGHFAYREGKWKLLLAKGSGGWTSPTETEASGESVMGQLYDLESDPGETTNLYDSQPEVVERLLAQLTTYVEAGRSTEGPPSSNDVEAIKIWK